MAGHHNVRAATTLVGPKSGLQFLDPTTRPNQLFFAVDVHELWETDPPDNPTQWRIVLRNFTERVSFLIAPTPVSIHIPNVATEFLEAPWLRVGVTFNTASVQAQVVCVLTDVPVGVNPNAQIRAEYSTDSGATWAPLGVSGGPTASLTAIGSQTDGFETVVPGVVTGTGGPVLTRLVYENGGNGKFDFGRASLLIRIKP